jgi:predicted PurR-regulated permease PerM
VPPPQAAGIGDRCCTGVAWRNCADLEDEVDDRAAPTERETQATAGQPTTSTVVHKIEISGKFIWQAIGAILATLVLLWALMQARGLVSMVLIAFFFSLALEPAVRWLTGRYGWRRGSATGVIYLAGAAFVIFMIVVLIPAIAELAKVIGERGSEWISNVNEWTSDKLGFELTSAATAEDLAEGTESALEDFSSGAFGQAIDIAAAGIGLVFNMATIAMFTFYFTADAPRVQRAVLRLFSAKAQQRIGWTWDQAIVQTGGYFYSRMILMVINGIGFFFTMVAVGVPVSLSIPLALFGSFVSVFIPAVGTYIGGAVPILVTLAVQGLVPALVVLGYVLVYQQVENYWLSPRISAQTMTLNGGLAFGAALAGGAIAGPMGAFTALPIAALISSFISNYVASHEVVYQSEQTAPAGEKPPRRKRRRRGGDAGSPEDSTP